MGTSFSGCTIVAAKTFTKPPTNCFSPTGCWSLPALTLKTLASDDEKIWKTSLENYVVWLQRVFLRSPKSPVIVIGTHLDAYEKDDFFLNLFFRPQSVLQKVSQRLRSRLESLPFFTALILPDSTLYDTPDK